MILLQGARERVEHLQFSPDGRTLLAPCRDGVQVWHNVIAGGRPSTTLDYPSVSRVCFTPDGSKGLLDASATRVVIHNLATGKAVEVPLEFAQGGGKCDLTPDSRYVVVARTYNGADPPGRLSCRPIRSPEKTLWSVTTSSWIFSRPLFRAGGKRFAVFEVRRDTPPFWYVTRDARTGQVLTQVGVSGHRFESGHQFASQVLSADRKLITVLRNIWLGVFRADDFAAPPVVIRNDSL